MNEMHIAELARIRQTAMMREAANERLARSLKPEREAKPELRHNGFARRLLHALTARHAPNPA